MGGEKTGAFSTFYDVATPPVTKKENVPVFSDQAPFSLRYTIAANSDSVTNLVP